MQAMLKCCCTHLHSGHTLNVRFAESWAQMQIDKAFSVVKPCQKLQASSMQLLHAWVKQHYLQAMLKHCCCTQYQFTQGVTASEFVEATTSASYVEALLLHSVPLNTGCDNREFVEVGALMHSVPVHIGCDSIRVC